MKLEIRGAARHLLVPGVLYIALGNSAFAVDCGDTITTPEVLDQDLVCSTEPALTIMGPAGSLDMAEFTLRCDGSAVGIQIDGVSAFLSNGVVTLCDIGISIDGAGSHNIQTIRVDGADISGISVNSSFNSIIQSGIFKNNGTGIFIAGDNNTISSSSILDNLENGIQLEGSRNLIVSNDISRSTLNGILIGKADGNTVAQNTVSMSGIGGANTAGILLELLGQSGNVIVGNTVFSNIDFDLQDNNSSPCLNSWIGNSPDATTSGDCVTSN
ncbi:NosD domain-containing protein [Microbulbifer sp. JMSA003]|uniref:NosD domain-containing protein n=1 Tax=Microbulbifer sp. JMSA003 TaxID=3243369 RepID=UPI0040392531